MTYKEMKIEISKIQRRAITDDKAILVIFEGLNASGKGTIINSLLQALDPRGYRVYSNNGDTKEEKLRAPMWKFWRNIPKKGEIAIFDRSWYFDLVRSLEKKFDKKTFLEGMERINETEKLLKDNGVEIIKFFIHIEKKEQFKRLNKLDSDKSTSWRVTKSDWKSHDNYEKIHSIYTKAIKKSTIPFYILETKSKKEMTLDLFNRLLFHFNLPILPVETHINLEPYDFSLDSINLKKELSKEDYDMKLKKLQKKLRKLEHELYEKRIPLIIAYEGWDAGGKGGNIKRLVEGLDPRGYDVLPIAAPTKEELAYHYLWRFWTKYPKNGHIAIFDRTWYGRVLVERVEGFCSEIEWKRAYQEINNMEKEWVEADAIVIKFWIHIDKDEQLRRFHERENIPYKNYKITEEDWRNRDKWDQYQEAVEEMIARTNTELSPWVVIEGNNKYYARIKALETVIKKIEEKMKI